MIIKHLYHNDTHVANAYLHKRNATVDIKWLDSLQGADTSIERSEERRVGKECRSRWSPYH